MSFPNDSNSQSEFEELLESSFNYQPPRRGEIRTATILQIDTREIIVDMGVKQDGIVPAQDIERLDPEVRNGLKVGAEVPVYVLNPRDQDDNLIVSINMGLQQYDWERARQLLKSEDVVQVVVTGSNKGGVLVRWNRLEGFIPSSHLVSVNLTSGHGNWDDLRDKELGVKIMPFTMLVYVPNEDRYEEISKIHEDTPTLNISGTQVRDMLKGGIEPPIEVSRPEVARVLIEAMQERVTPHHAI